MTISKAQIFNVTLNILGISSPIENVNSSDNKAILLNNYYDLARDYVLKDFDWNFASAFKKLALCSENFPYSNFQYCYDYPNDCICARDVFCEGNYIQNKFAVSSLDNGNVVILTNVENAVLRYTKRVEKEVFFSCEFAMALSYYLASLSANVLLGSIQKGELAWEKYRKILSHAKVLNAYEGLDSIYSENTYLDSRG